jgi:hypothetical protein
MRLMADRTPLAFPLALANSAANLVKEAIAAQVVSLFQRGVARLPDEIAQRGGDAIRGTASSRRAQ